MLSDRKATSFDGLVKLAVLGTAAGLLAWCVRAGFFSFLLSTRYLPHQFCYLAQPGLVWTNVVMDGLIAGSYLGLFAGLFWMARKLRIVEGIRSYLWIVLAFGTFIIACGMTHVMEMVTVWWPAYRLSAAVKVVCAAASVPTAVLFLKVAPALAANIERFVGMLRTTQQEKDRALSSLIAAEKLAVAGRISASIAHEIKNPLESVGNLLYLMRTEAGATPALIRLIETAGAEIARAREIAQSTLSLHRESTQPVMVALEPLVRSVLELQMPQLMRLGVTLRSRIVAPVLLYAYPSDVRQILINLIENAAAAAGPGGWVAARVKPQRGGYSFTIADSGPGIPVEHRTRLFSLFFTTKGESGTGIGLWLVQSLVEKHGGRIVFRTRTEGEWRVCGTIFNVWVPAAAVPERAPGVRSAVAEQAMAVPLAR